MLLQLLHGELVASAPEPIRGLIEARWYGPVAGADPQPGAGDGAGDLDEALRPNACRCATPPGCLGQEIVRVKRVDGAHFAPALMQFLRCGALDPDA